MALIVLQKETTTMEIQYTITLAKPIVRYLPHESDALQFTSKVHNKSAVYKYGLLHFVTSPGYSKHFQSSSLSLKSIKRTFQQSIGITITPDLSVYFPCGNISGTSPDSTLYHG